VVVVPDGGVADVAPAVSVPDLMTVCRRFGMVPPVNVEPPGEGVEGTPVFAEPPGVHADVSAPAEIDTTRAAPSTAIRRRREGRVRRRRTGPERTGGPEDASTAAPFTRSVEKGYSTLGARARRSPGGSRGRRLAFAP